jgi:lambda repressor-like predicted transcriptional regulator
MDTKNLTAKEFLSRAYHIDQRINSKLEQVQSLRDLATKATATLSNMPQAASRNHHRMEDFITKAMDLESEINADLQALINIKHEVVTVIKCVESPDLQTLLEHRYLCYRTWEEVAAAMNFDVRHITRLHGRALRVVEQIRHHQ